MECRPWRGTTVSTSWCYDNVIRNNTREKRRMFLQHLWKLKDEKKTNNNTNKYVL